MSRVREKQLPGAHPGPSIAAPCRIFHPVAQHCLESTPTFCQQLQCARVAAIKLQQVHAPGGKCLGIQVVVVVTAREASTCLVPDIAVDSQLQPLGVDLCLQTEKRTGDGAAVRQ